MMRGVRFFHLPSALLVAVATSTLSCASAPPASGPPPQPITELDAPPPAPPVTSTKTWLSTHDALARTLAFEEEGDDSDLDEPDELRSFVQKHELDRATVLALLEAVARPCLAHAPPKEDPCERLGKDGSDEERATEVLIDLAVELADVNASADDTVRLLVRLDSRGVFHAGWQLQRLLERRALSALGPCAPPSESEVAAARATLSGVRIEVPGRAPRAPSATQLADLAYLHAAVAASGEPVGTHPLDTSSKALPEGHPDLERREALRAEMEVALWEGDLERHARAAEAYVVSLGYPGPIRANEDGRMGWHGRPYTFVMREWGRSAEILRDFATAEAVYRHAMPGGGPSGTGNAHKHNQQIGGIIRSAEQAVGCRRVVSERLYAVSSDYERIYGPDRLAKAGFDVGRLYTAALLTSGQPDAWASRVRAIAGFGDTRQKEALPKLLELAQRGKRRDRLEALRVIGRMVQSYGIDPCKPSNTLRMSGSSRAERSVRSIMDECETALDEPAMKAVIKRLAALSTDSDPRVREGVAEALGNSASPAARPTLERLARDTYDAGGERCVTVDDQPEVCGPNLPVKHAAEDGLEALREAEETRAEQRRDPP